MTREKRDDAISRQWLMECVNEGWIKFDIEKDKNIFIHLIRDIAPPVETIKALEQETSYDDAIRREDALQALCKAVHKNDDTIPCPNQRASCLWSKTKVQDYAREIWKIPPVTPQPKIGHWIDKDGRSAVCSCCSMNNTLFGNYCKWCGAKMMDEEG